MDNSVSESSQVDLIREAFHYQSRFESSTMVFKIDFPVTEDPGFSYLMKDLALLARTGFRVVIVPGAKEWIDSVLLEHGIVSNYAGTKRITTGAAIPFVEMAAFHVATRVMTGLAAGSSPSDVTGRVDAVIGNFVRARGLGVESGVDMEHTGMVDRILTDPIGRVLNLEMVPILPCIGWSSAGKPYNVSSDEIALAASTALGAIKLFIVSLDPGLRAGAYRLPENIQVGEKGRIVRLTPQEAEAILGMNSDKAGDKPLEELRLALGASRAGVERVHIINGREEGAVLRELFSNLGVGTMVYADDYESIRALKPQDIPDLLRLMEPLMQQGILLRRRPEDIQEKMGDYAVFEIDGSVHACGALHDWGESQGEIAALATDPAYADMGLGGRIVRYLIDRAQRQGFRRVFVLTTRTQDWFEFLGFKECPIESLPERKRRIYDRNRKSKAFALEL
ncbi:amino-acid N-acetyltransferase [Treponema primitia ZAS-2]|uniref:amino-acid N-acetyltransferase n=1 Tax=Treponema primitia (strain ATCC BAA-887 / DSM 12427 / ZAS-2) TaxID=545694 RepID=F5YPR8_TREPZ|nr:amino-acid N-acetyltransferase [Treponema primitia]AEF84330.1 amino-acid N-acetyltransferase [Treponema primitia ZAS-2]